MRRPTATLLLCSLLAACAYPYNVGVVAADGATVELVPGQSASLPDGKLRYIRIVNDSRCPPNVQCVWAGDAVIALQWTPSTGSGKAVELHLNPSAGTQQADLSTRRVTFVGLQAQGTTASLHFERLR